MRRRATKPIITIDYNNLITKQEQEKRELRLPKFRRLSTNVAPSKISSGKFLYNPSQPFDQPLWVKKLLGSFNLA